jgi:formylglycine-generating enzyme required for sulfatase activity
LFDLACPDTLTVDRRHCRACAEQDFGKVLWPSWWGVSIAGPGKSLIGGHVMRNCVVMKSSYSVVALLVMVVCVPTALARKWTESTGKYTVEAEFVDFKDGKVRLKKESGTVVAIPLERLSAADQEWVKQQEGPKQPPRLDGVPKELTVDLGGGVKIDFVLIPAGSFQMGDEKGKSNEKPVHKVNITKPFYLGKYEVTQEQWQAVMGSNPSHFKGPKNPVEQVSWDNCQAFLNKLNEKSRSGGVKFGLPTEAQWEYACRAGTTTQYSVGDDPAKLGDYAWWKENAEKTTHPVGQKKPNAWGLYDMHGNVFEWCADWYAAYSNSSVDDSTGPTSGSDRVLRGGCWSFDAGLCRSAFRFIGTPAFRFHILGFRVASVPVDASGK